MSCSGLVERLRLMYPCCRPCDPDFCKEYLLKRCKGNREGR